jgi:predicted DNA-binding antitoxin AbrB/MazE fold protein
MKMAGALMSAIDAIYRKGVFEPLQPVDLRDNQRVRLRIEAAPETSSAKWLQDVRRLHESIIATHGLLPDSTPDIASDRLR